MFSECLQCRKRTKQSTEYGWATGCNYAKFVMHEGKHHCVRLEAGTPEWKIITKKRRK